MAQRIEGMKSFTFITSDEVTQPGGSQGERYFHYKAVTPRETRYFTFVLTADGKVADFYSDL